MKAHEETWYVENGSVMVQVGPTRGGDDFVMETGGTSSRAARRTLASSAPDMARLLIDFLNNYEFGEAVDDRISAALKKAGVLP